MSVVDISQKIIKSYHQKQQPVFVAVAGGSSLGKTSYFVPHLRRSLQKELDVVVIQQDQFRDFGIPKDQYHITYQGDDPFIYQLERCFECLSILKTGMSVEIPAWSLQVNPQSGQKEISTYSQVIHPGEVIIFEGFYAIFPPLTMLADISIYLEGPAWSRLIRRIIRNWIERGYGNPKDICNYFVNAVLPAHRQFVVQQRWEADIILAINYRFEDSLDRFELPSTSLSQEVLNLFYSFDIDPHTYFRIISTREKPWLFEWIYNSKVFVRFDMEPRLAIQIAQEDWLAY